MFNVVSLTQCGKSRSRDRTHLQNAGILSQRTRAALQTGAGLSRVCLRLELEREASHPIGAPQCHTAPTRVHQRQHRRRERRSAREQERQQLRLESQHGVRVCAVDLCQKYTSGDTSTIKQAMLIAPRRWAVCSALAAVVLATGNLQHASAFTAPAALSPSLGFNGVVLARGVPVAQHRGIARCLRRARRWRCQRQRGTLPLSNCAIDGRQSWAPARDPASLTYSQRAAQVARCADVRPLRPRRWAASGCAPGASRGRSCACVTSGRALTRRPSCSRRWRATRWWAWCRTTARSSAARPPQQPVARGVAARGARRRLTRHARRAG